MTSDKKFKLLLNTMIMTVLSLLLFLSSCPEEPDNYYDDSDTTSHNFVWQIDTLGLYGSYLNDVWIVDENNIWVVGYIRVPDPDSSFDGTGKETFNAAHWNGEKWNMMRIVNSSPIFSIHYFNENDIWMVSYGYPVNFNGNSWTLYRFHDMGINASALSLWGSSSSNIYFVGLEGSIVHYDGKGFEKMESGTDTQIIDIWGTGAHHIWATAKSNQLDDAHPNGYESVTLFCNGQQWTRQYESPIGHTTERSATELKGYMNSVWAYKDTVYISSNSGLWKESIKKGKGQLMHGPDNRLNGFPFLVRGTGYNDVYAFTHWGEFLHFNGKTWNRDLSLDGINVMKASVTEDLVVTVGDMAFRYIVIVRGHHVK
ncbi:MAG TPA: hypothetical protein P5268_02995 [Candidatus Marinimicrobia bacterium]|nr:hypothetical protein [Candidatus Neomarinimicrobiota bacterium]HRS52194.1 hypothetical protein [Candidatus Neomarinimicrobiota bacterium]HRU91985.1 hypothetical protein [Candidatus Neomarinimicrobiota bacterium]